MKRERLGLGSVALVLAGLAAAAPLLLGPSALELVGALLIVAGVLDGLHSFRRVSLQAQRSAYASAGLTVLMGLLVLGAPLLVGTALTLLLAGSFLVDGFQRAAELRRRKENRTPVALVLATLGNLAAAALLLLLWRTSPTWTASLAGALRIFGAGWNMVTTPVHTGGQAGSDVIRSLGLPDHPEMLRLGERLTEEERARRPYDRRWVVAFAATLFAIHVGSHAGRLDPDRPAGPCRRGDRRPRGGAAHRLRRARADSAGGSSADTGAGASRLDARRAPRRAACVAPAGSTGCSGCGSPEGYASGSVLRQTRYSLPFALERGAPDGAADHRGRRGDGAHLGDELVLQLRELGGGDLQLLGRAADRHLAVGHVACGPGRHAGGESGAGLHATPAGNRRRLRVPGDRRSRRGRRVPARPARSDHPGRGRPEVRFMVISSDVIYPTGSMKNYEANFWLPFKGFTKPVYAIPGNHDWYDALEGFTATFFAPEAAAVAMRARVESDHRLTSTTDGRIAWLVGEAARLRREYGVPTGFQQAPYFQIQTERFALLAVDTGVLRARRSRSDRVATRRARAVARQVHDGHPRPSAVRRWAVPGRRRRGVRGHSSAPARARRRPGDGGGHARPRALRRAVPARTAASA